MKKYDLQKRIASELLKVGENRVSFNPKKLKEIGEAITREDIRALIHNKSIIAKPVKGISRSRAKTRHAQKKKGRQRGEGKKKGKFKSRTPKKRAWINKIRSQRELLTILLDKKVIDKSFYRRLYRLAKAGFFRNKSHLKLFIKKKKPSSRTKPSARTKPKAKAKTKAVKKKTVNKTVKKTVKAKPKKKVVKTKTKKRGGKR